MATISINGKQIEVPAGAIAYKYADPTEGARWVYEQDDLSDIRREDPSLVVEVPQLTTFRWRTDAASGEMHAETAQQVLNQLVWDREWADIDTAREQRDITDGSWLLIAHEDGTHALTRGIVP